MFDSWKRVIAITWHVLAFDVIVQTCQGMTQSLIPIFLLNVGISDATTGFLFGMIRVAPALTGFTVARTITKIGYVKSLKNALLVSFSCTVVLFLLVALYEFVVFTYASAFSDTPPMTSDPLLSDSSITPTLSSLLTDNVWSAYIIAFAVAGIAMAYQAAVNNGHMVCRHAIVSKIVPSSQHGTIFSLLGGCMRVGSTFGPMIISVALHLSYSAGFACFCAMSALAAVGAWSLLGEDGGSRPGACTCCPLIAAVLPRGAAAPAHDPHPTATGGAAKDKAADSDLFGDEWDATSDSRGFARDDPTSAQFAPPHGPDLRPPAQGAHSLIRRTVALHDSVPNATALQTHAGAPQGGGDGQTPVAHGVAALLSQQRTAHGGVITRAPMSIDVPTTDPTEPTARTRDDLPSTATTPPDGSTRPPLPSPSLTITSAVGAHPAPLQRASGFLPLDVCSNAAAGQGCGGTATTTDSFTHAGATLEDLASAASLSFAAGGAHNGGHGVAGCGGGSLGGLTPSRDRPPMVIASVSDPALNSFRTSASAPRNSSSVRFAADCADAAERGGGDGDGCGAADACVGAADAPAAEEASSLRDTLRIYWRVAVANLVFNLLVAYPRMARNLIVSIMAKRAGLSPSSTSLFLGTMSFTDMALFPTSAILMNYSRRTSAAVSGCGLCIAFIVLSFADTSPTVLWIACLLLGAGNAAGAGVLMAIAADGAPQSQGTRPHFFALMRWGVLGEFVAAALSGYLAESGAGPANAALIAAGTSFASWLWFEFAIRTPEYLRSLAINAPKDYFDRK